MLCVFFKEMEKSYAGAYQRDEKAILYGSVTGKFNGEEKELCRMHEPFRGAFE